MSNSRLQPSPALSSVLHCGEGFKQCLKCKKVHCGCKLYYGCCMHCVNRFVYKKQVK